MNWRYERIDPQLVLQTYLQLIKIFVFWQSNWQSNRLSQSTWHSRLLAFCVN